MSVDSFGLNLNPGKDKVNKFGEADFHADGVEGASFEEILGLSMEDEPNRIVNSQQVSAAGNISPLPGIGEPTSHARLEDLNKAFNGIIEQQLNHKHSRSFGG